MANESRPSSGGSQQTAPPPTIITPAGFICGPDVSAQVITTWTKIQDDFRAWTPTQKMQVCNKILIPYKKTGDEDKSGMPHNWDELKHKAQLHADINGWDTIPLYQGASSWLRTPPVYDDKIKGPCATPSSSKQAPDADPFDPAHEDPDTCSNSVQIGGKCWLNGTVNYGTFGIMVRLCRDFAQDDWINKLNPTIQAVYSLQWAKMLIRAYKQFGSNPEGADLPIAWVEATYSGGPTAVPSVPGNRPKCACSCGCKGSVAKWDYVWEPIKTRDNALDP